MTGRVVGAVAAAMLAVGCLTDAPDALGRSDVDGWRGVQWGTPVADVIAGHENAFVVQQTKMELNGCFVQYAIPLELFGESWNAWLCEDPDAPNVIAVNVESAVGRSDRFDEVLDGMSNALGLPHKTWLNCANALGASTVQYRWYFPSTTVTLLNRDLDKNWMVIRYAAPTDTAEYGPGRCWTAPIDSRGSGQSAGSAVQPATAPPDEGE